MKNVLSGVSLFVLLFAAAPALADCVGLSYDQYNNISGTWVGADTLADAESGALQNCKDQGGDATNCQNSVHGICGGYAALTVSDIDPKSNKHHYGVGTAPTSAQAVQLANGFCAQLGVNCVFQYVVPN